ncbi:MAG: phosphoadenylyl-sulfate reductase [Bacteroidota bacterium]
MKPTLDLQQLSQQYEQLDHKARLRQIFRDFDRVLITSSFGTTSTILLHHLSQVQPHHPVHFIDTKYLFGETHDYKQALIDRWNLNVVTIEPTFNSHDFTKRDYTWTYAADDCCDMNKVQPLNRLKDSHDVWISGMMGGTNEHRENMPIFREGKDILRFYPFIDMTEEEASWYQLIYDLPAHPLAEEGYGSVGCTHCTVKGKGREGRWAGSGKTECGLHVSK